MTTIGWVIIAIVAVLLVIIITILSMIQPELWFRARVSGTRVSVWTLLRIRFKKLDARMIVNNYIKARKSGVDISIQQMERHAQARGNVPVVVQALIAAHNAEIELSVEDAISVDLAGRDIKEAVKYCITPKVIETDKIAAIAKDGIEISVRAKITIRTNLKRIIKNALEETIIARVCEGIITSIGGATSHKEIIEYPDKISKNVLVNRSISDDTAFDIISVDIADVHTGRNVGAELEIDAAEATKFIAQAEAEKRRSVAVAAEQEMRVRTQAMKAQVLEAESMLPLAIAEAFKKGNITVNDYYKMQNVISDTEMRRALAGKNMMQEALPAPRKKSKLS